MSANPQVSVIVFAYNEAENIGPVLTELRAFLEKQTYASEIVFVDDGSDDGTLLTAKRTLLGYNAIYTSHKTNRGIGAAIKTAVALCHAPRVTFLPADGQIEPAAIATLLAQANETTDLVLSTYRQRDDGAIRKLLSWGVRTLILLVHGVRIRSEGPYLFRRRDFHPEQLHSESFFLNFEFPIQALRAGARSKNVEIECRPRRAGSSKSTGFSRVWGVAKELIAMRFRKP